MTLIEPKFEPWGPDPTPKVGSMWNYFLDLSLNPKLDPSSGHTNPIVGPEGGGGTKMEESSLWGS